jgi:hypothetical protein
MTDRPRYRLRAKGPALSRFQLWIMGAATLEYAIGLLLAAVALISGDVGEHVGTLALGGFLMGLSCTTSTLTIRSANGRDSSAQKLGLASSRGESHPRLSQNRT